MDNINRNSVIYTSVKSPVLKKIFNQFADETITESQIMRILEPIILMIRMGRFDPFRKKKTLWFLKPMLSIVAVLILSIIVGFFQKPKVSSITLSNSSPRVTLNSKEEISNILSGRLFQKEEPVFNAELQLIDFLTMQTVETTKTNIVGEYEFSNFPDGIYQMKVVIYDKPLEPAEYFVEIGGTTELVIGRENLTSWEGVNICL